jgi:thiamine-phosphate pyrophosphorylase
MCLTQDNLTLSHFEQAQRLCAAGARWIQVRMKHAHEAERYATVCAIVALCRKHDALCIVNDRLDLAMAANAHGVHLGKEDGDWRSARSRIGPDMILGGTVNNESDARRAIDAGCLDYVGIGPWRFTATKKNLAPVLGPAGVATLIAQLDRLPAWAIGGVGVTDFPEVRAAGAAGAAVSAALHREGGIAENFQTLNAVWHQALKL